MISSLSCLTFQEEVEDAPAAAAAAGGLHPVMGDRDAAAAGGLHPVMGDGDAAAVVDLQPVMDDGDADAAVGHTEVKGDGDADAAVAPHPVMGDGDAPMSGGDPSASVDRNDADVTVAQVAGGEIVLSDEEMPCVEDGYKPEQTPQTAPALAPANPAAVRSAPMLNRAKSKFDIFEDSQVVGFEEDSPADADKFSVEDKKEDLHSTKKKLFEEVLPDDECAIQDKVEALKKHLGDLQRKHSVMTL